MPLRGKCGSQEVETVLYLFAILNAVQPLTYCLNPNFNDWKGDWSLWPDCVYLMLVQAHTEYVLAKSFVDFLKDLHCNDAVKEALNKMCAVFMVNLVVENAGDLVQVIHSLPSHTHRISSIICIAET